MYCVYVCIEIKSSKHFSNEINGIRTTELSYIIYYT